MLFSVDTAPSYHSETCAEAGSLTLQLINFYPNYSSLEYLRLSMCFRGLGQEVGARRS